MKRVSLQVRPAESFSGAWDKKRDGTRDDVIKIGIVIVACIVSNFIITFSEPL